MSGIVNNSFLQAAGYELFYRSAVDVAAVPSTPFSSVGIIRAGDDYNLKFRKSVEAIVTAQFGQTEVDAVYVGQSCRLNAVLVEINRVAALKIAHQESNGLVGELGQIGALASNIGGEVKLKPFFENLPTLEQPAGGGNNIMYLPCCVMDEEAELTRMLSAQLHFTPISLKVLPFIDEADNDKLKFFNFVSS